MSSDHTIIPLDNESPAEADQLQFQDFSHQEPRGLPPTDTPYTLTTFPHPDDSDEEVHYDKTGLLGNKESQPTSSIWTFAYYASFFDVDTDQVLRRILGSFIPNPRTNFLTDLIRPNPDLYGPFWICTTLVFTIAISGNLAEFFVKVGAVYELVSDFTKVTIAATVIFCYWWLVPALLSLLLWWRGLQMNLTFTETISIYGYSLAIYIPISIFLVIQLAWLQWIFILVGMSLSGAVLVMTIWPALKNANFKMAAVVAILIMALHCLLAVGFKLYFFQTPLPQVDWNTTTPLPFPDVTNASTVWHSTTNLSTAPTQVTTAPLETTLLSTTTTLQSTTTLKAVTTTKTSAMISVLRSTISSLASTLTA